MSQKGNDFFCHLFSNRILVYHKFATQKKARIFFSVNAILILFSLRRKEDDHDTDSGIFYHVFYGGFYIAVLRSLPVAIPTFRCCSRRYLLSAGRINRISSCDSASLLSQMILCGLMITFVELLLVWLSTARCI